MLKFISSVSPNTFLKKAIFSNSITKRTLFAGVPKINKPLDEVYNKYTHIPEINESYNKLVQTLVDENKQKLIDLGIKPVNNDTTLQLDSVWRKKTGMMTRHKHKKRRKANQILIVQKKALKKQKRANAEAKENYLLANGIEFYKH
ncbi:hypothetical protein DAHU10_002620 [Hanseniaspora uvarum]|nr:hypothetical protein DAHU10_002620 [Hanseniaspora uvarum]